MDRVGRGGEEVGGGGGGGAGEDYWWLTSDEIKDENGVDSDHDMFRPIANEKMRNKTAVG